METIDFEVSTNTTVPQVTNHDMSVEESMLFGNLEASDFPPCKIKYFNPSVDFVAILASHEAKNFNSLTCKRQIGDISTQDEARRILAEIHITMKEVMESKFYSKMTDQLQNDPDIQNNIKRVLGSHSHVVMVIYALGGIEHSYHSQYQLAIALLLKHDFSNWIGEIEVYDPMFSPSDCMALEELGCKVLSVNEHCRREVTKPTLFFMPYAETTHTLNVMDANWCPSKINRMILLSVITSGNNESCNHFHAVTKYKSEFRISPLTEDHWIFTNFAWTFFNVEPELDMETLFPGQFSKEILMKEGIKKSKLIVQCGDYIHSRNCGENFLSRAFKRNDEFEGYWDLEYRIPRRHGCLWQAPQIGWIKLNFSGKGDDKNSPAGFGGIFRNEFKDHMVVYSGNLGEADTTVASVESLRQGLRCLQYMPHVKRLVVEGNDLSVIRWVNKHGVEPPEKIREALLEIFDLLGKMVSVVYNVYEEANSLAIDLANKGAKLHNLRIWVAPS